MPITGFDPKRKTKAPPQRKKKASPIATIDPDPGQIYKRIQHSATLAPEDMMTLQSSVGNSAVTGVAEKHRTQQAKTSNRQFTNRQTLKNNPRIQREDGQAANLYAERNYARITNEQQQQIDTFASRAQTLIGPWGELRQSVSGTGAGMSHGDYLNRLGQIKSQLHNAYNQFTRDFGETVSTMPTQGAATGILLAPSNRHQVPFHSHNLARIELARQLNQGFFPQYFREIETLHGLDGATLVNLRELMTQHAGMQIPRLAHTYRLRTIIGIEGGAGEVVTGGAFIRAFVIEYSNDLGMSWRVNTYGGALKIGAGVSVSPVEANIDTSMGSNEINAGTANELRYYPPSYFRANLVTATTASAAAGGGVAMGRMSFGDVDFDTSGLVVRFGTSNVGEAGTDIALGGFFGGSAYNVQDLAEPQAAQLQPRAGQWIPVIAGRCHFRTEEATLDGEDEASLDRVVEAILRHERFYPGDLFRIGVKGFASQQWSTPQASARAYGVDTSDINQPGSTREERDSQTAERLNEELARNRARVTGTALANRIVAQSSSFSAGVIDRSSLRDNQYEVIHVDSPDADRNAATNRYVQIAVYYNNSPDGNVNYNPLAE